jgi:hypothetical protein
LSLKAAAQGYGDLEVRALEPAWGIWTV